MTLKGMEVSWAVEVVHWAGVGYGSLMLLAMVFELPFVIVTGLVLSPGLMLLYWERSRAMAETKEKEGEKGKKEKDTEEKI